MTHQSHLNPEGLPSIEALVLDIEAKRVQAARMARVALEQERQAKAAEEQRRVRMATFFRADARHTAGILNAQGLAPAQRHGTGLRGVPPLWHIATTKIFNWTTPGEWVITKKGGPMVTTYHSTRSDDMSREYSYPDEGYWTKPVDRHAEEQLGLSQDGRVYFVRTGDEPEVAATGSRFRLATDGDIWTLISLINNGRSVEDPALDPALIVGWRTLLAGVVAGAQPGAGSQG